MFRLIFILFVLCTLNYATAQVACTYASKPPPSEAAQETMMYGIIETQPQLLTRLTSIDDSLPNLNQTGQHLLHFIYRNLRYPPLARDCCISGTVVVSFTIGTDGFIAPNSIRCPRDIGGGCGDEGLRLVQLMIDLGFRWIPATQAGKIVPVQFNLPIKFKLQ